MCDPEKHAGSHDHDDSFKTDTVAYVLRRRLRRRVLACGQRQVATRRHCHGRLAVEPWR